VASVNLQIKSDSEQAQADFKALADSSDLVRAKIEKFSESFKTEKIQEFSDKNRLAAIAAEATGGKLAGMSREAAGLKSEIEKLIKNGMSPQDEKMKVLVNDYNRLQGEIAQTTNSTKQETTATVDMTAAMVKAQAIFAAGKAVFMGVFNVVKDLTVGLSQQGDELAKTSRRLGITVEGYQELTYAADMSGVSAESMTTALEFMSKQIGQAQIGQGKLKKYLEETNPVLLAQVTAAKNADEAFMLLANAASGIQNPMEAAAFATAAFGGSGQELLQLTAEGADGIAFLREEAQRYGNVMSTEVAEAAERFNDSQANATAAIKAVGLSIGGDLLAPMADVMQGFAEWASTNDNLKNTLGTLATVAITVAGAVGTYAAATAIATGALSAASIATAVMTAAQWALNAAMNANPIALIATAIVAVLIPAIIYLVKNWDTAQFVILQGLEQIKIFFLYAAKVVGVSAALMFAPFLVGINLIIVAFNKLTGKNIPTVTDAFKSMNGAIDAQIAKSQGNIATLGQKHAAAVAKHADANKSSVGKMNADSNARLANEKTNTAGVIAEHEKEKESVRSKEVTYKQMLDNIQMTELQKQNEMLNQTVSFFEQRATLESEDFNARIAYLQGQYATLAAMDNLSKEERIAAEAGLTAAIKKQQELQMQMYFSFAQQILSNTRQMFEDLSTVMKNSGKESRKLAMATRAVAIAEAVMSAHLAAAKSLAAFPWPFNLVAAGVSYAAGAARVAAISSTKLPSAQTGGEFTVPDTPATRNDKAVVMASGGESVSVSPRGESGNKQTVVNVQFDKFKLFQVVQEGVDTGQINVSDRNIGTAVFA